MPRAPSDQKSAGAENNLLIAAASSPPPPVRLSVGIVGGLLDSDERVGLRHGALGRRDVRTPLQQLRGNADGDGGHRRGQHLHRHGKLRGGFADERGDGVLVDGAVGGDAGAGLFGVFQRYFGLGNILGAVDAGIDEGSGEFEGFAVGLDGAVVQVLQRILPAQFEVIDRRDRPAR